MNGVLQMMTRLGAIAVAAAVCEFALPKGNLRSSGRKAISLMVLVCTIQCVLDLMGEL
ncbi:MAG TPA: hypothetical protein VN540_02890 [Clostridia bacterium]|nr:hypothetical protein [Clostridia bacterium]